MTVKFKVRFTVDAETLARLIAKTLPIEDLHVEELMEERQDPMRQVHAITKVSRGRGRRFGALNLQAGANAVVVKLLSDGKPHRAAELKPLMRAAGFSLNAIGSRLLALHHHGIVFQPEVGLWQLKQPLEESA